MNAIAAEEGRIVAQMVGYATPPVATPDHFKGPLAAAFRRGFNSERAAMRRRVERAKCHG